jgi:hypothetical protein
MKLRSQTLTNGETRTATYSDSERHRFALHIQWSHGPRWLMVIGLNPSTATELQDDPTVLRCKKRAKALGFHRLVMCNLFAYRATAPKDMQALDPADAIGGLEQMNTLRQEAAAAEIILCAWGEHGAHSRQAHTVLRLLNPHRAKFRCLALNQSGHPKHPLYCRNDAVLIPYNP